MIRLLLVIPAVLASLAVGAATTAQLPYTKDQAWRGRLSYYEHCAECHGGGLEGNFGPALAGGDDRVQFETGKYVYGYLSVFMPHGNPGALPQNDYVDIMAFLLQQHGYPDGPKPLTVKAVNADLQPVGP